MTLDDCEVIFDKALNCGSESEFCHTIAPLFNEYKILSIEYGRGSIFWRARLINDDVFKNISELDYPPADYVSQGRLNDKGAPCFYISARKETAIAEVGATEGQLVQLAGFRVIKESTIRLAVIGEYANVQKSGYMHFGGKDPDMTISKIMNEMPRHEALKQIYIDKFFAHVLADPEASSNGYMYSRALGHAIYSKNSSEGIVFPSVKDRGGFNVAVLAALSDRSFHNVSCIVVKIEKKRLFGTIDFSVVKSAERLDEDWNFVWLGSDSPEIIGIYNMTEEEYKNAVHDPGDKNSLLNMLRAKRKLR